MDITTLQNFILSHGYFFILLIMIIEGPVVNFIASFLASQGYFNIFIIGVLAILGDLLGDILLYFIGMFKMKKIKQPPVLKNKSKLEFVNQLIKEHLFKAILIIKLTPPISMLGLVLAGKSKANFRKYFLYTLLISTLIELPLTILGYFSRISIVQFSKYYDSTLLDLTIFMLLLLLFIFSMIKLKNKISSNLLKDDEKQSNKKTHKLNLNKNE